MIILYGMCIFKKEKFTKFSRNKVYINGQKKRNVNKINNLPESNKNNNVHSNVVEKKVTLQTRRIYNSRAAKGWYQFQSLMQEKCLTLV